MSDVIVVTPEVADPEPAPVATAIVVEPPITDQVTPVDINHEQRLTHVEAALEVLAPVVENIATLVEFMDERISMAHERITETQDAVVETQEVIADTAEATESKADDAVVEDEVPTDTTHRWWR